VQSNKNSARDIS